MAYLIHLGENDIITNISILSEEDFSSGSSAVKAKFNLNDSFLIASEITNGIAIGDIYNSDKDRLEPAQPYPSWIWNEEDFAWQSPVPRPKLATTIWDEETLSWIEVNNGSA